MGSIITTKKGLLKLVKGQIEVEVNGSNQPAKDGEQLPKGAVLHIGENATYEITFDDGTKLSNEVEPSIAATPNAGGQATQDEIQALQDLIASGEDPTQNLPETAAGNAPAGRDGNSGYVTLARDGTEALATSGYSTSGQTFTAATTAAPEQTVATDSPSVLVNDSITVDEDTVASGNVLDNDSDADNVLSVVGFNINGTDFAAGTVVALEGGSFILNADGSYTFTPNENWNGQVPVITYTTNTGSTATLTINVTPVDDPSVLANDTNTVAEDTVATGNVLDNDTDVDSSLSVVSFTVSGSTFAAGTTVALEGGSLVLNADGSYSFTPNADWNGQVPVITYTTNTGSTATLTINVTPVDDPSALANDSNTVPEDTVAAGNVLDNDSDIDNTLSVVSYSVNGQTIAAGTAVTLEGGSLLINADGSYSFTPNANWNGQVPVITYTTNTGSTATLTINVTPVDDPSALANDSNTVPEDTVAAGNVLDNDSDIDNTLSVVSYSVNGQTIAAGTAVTLEGGSLLINADGSYTFTPNANWNGQVPVITYTTNTGSTATLTIEVTPVDDPSVLANDSNTVPEDTVAAGNVLDNDSDIDNTLSVVSYSVNGQTIAAGTAVTLEGGSLLINADGSYTFTPNANWNGQVPVITYTTNTGSTATLTIEVTPVDDPSVLANDSNTVPEDTVAAGNVLDNDSDIDNTLSVVSYSVNGQTIAAGTAVTLEGGSLLINADGSYTFTPNANWNGQVPVITYTTNTGSTATLTIEVTPVNDAPVAQDNNYTATEDTLLTGNIITDNDATHGVDSDVDSPTLTIATINGAAFSANGTDPDHLGSDGWMQITLTNGTLFIKADGTTDYLPNANSTAGDSFTYTITDGSASSNTATVTIGVNAVNDAPVAQDNNYTATEDTLLTGNIITDNDATHGVDSDVDSPTLTIATINGAAFSANGTDPDHLGSDGWMQITLTNGTLFIKADGTTDYLPNANSTAGDSFTYTITDGSASSNTATVTIGV
ncbi:hypothetical protein CBX96_11420, partial [Shewanella sp. BC20]|uniref:retention module-containing protein n=1 Tax=Shewanella sp. BC20 TaxID=2004459 RepID=UPI000D66E4DD